MAKIIIEIEYKDVPMFALKSVKPIFKSAITHQLTKTAGQKPDNIEVKITE